MGDYKKLKVWEAADTLAVALYRHTKGFPNHELYGLRSQLRRAVVSIPSNLAEGAGRNTDKEFRHFTSIALGSANEVAYQVHLSGRLGYLKPDVVAELEAKAEVIKRMLAALLRKSVG
ncbi:MAG: four helix bundle protein [Gemmatimonadota bacterium]